MFLVAPLKTPRVFLTILAVAATVISPGLAVQGQRASRAGKVFPRIRIQNPVRGHAIIGAIGDHLDEIAQWYGKSSEDLDTILRTDPDIWADSSGRLYEICEFGVLPPDASGASAKPATSVTGSIQDVVGDQTFTLHGRRGSSKVIYLDFDGHETSGTLWNSLSGRSTIATPAYDIDGNVSEFSQEELKRIRGIWARVVEDFAPFDVDITTEQPPPEALSRASSSDQTFGIRVIVGGSSLDWYGPAAGGASYIGSFSWTSETSAFVFEEQLGNGNEKYTAEAISHEAGHSLGLFHDGQTNGNAYYGGHASWAPIMGMSYSKEITQWSKGEYSLANNSEDDLFVIQNNGVSYRVDDHGNLASSATRLTGTTLEASGVIERASDVDFFSFSTSAGAINLIVAVPAAIANLDLAAALIDSSGTVVSTGATVGMGVMFSANLPGGTYYLRVEGIGVGDGVQGFTDYASLGQYTLTGTVVAAPSRPPVAKASANRTSGTSPLVVLFSSGGSSATEGAITDYQWTFGDGGNSKGLNPAYTYLREGTYTATLTVTDDKGLTAKDSLTIVVGPPANQPPTANATATPQRGVAPLQVRFSSSGSVDPDGPIASYQWAFGNGSTSVEANPILTYMVPGSYTAVLTVTDNKGARSLSSVIIEVAPAPIEGPVVFVRDISLSLRPIRVQGVAAKVAQAVVTISDSQRPRNARATVTGTWVGTTSQTVTGVTDAMGRVTFTSRPVRGNENLVFIVSQVSAPGFSYDPSRNLVTQGSVSVD